MTQTDTTRPLDYAPPPPLHRRRRFRLALYAIILIGLFPAFVHFTPMAVNHLRLLYWQREVRQHEPPPRQTILKMDGSLHMFTPEPRWTGAGGPGGPDGTIYKGMRDAGTGERVVGVYIGPIVGTNQLLMFWSVFEPARLTRKLHPLNSNAVPLNVDLAYNRTIEIFAGRRDPADASHFTIECLIDGAELRTFDGWLLPDDTIIIERRREP